MEVHNDIMEQEASLPEYHRFASLDLISPLVALVENGCLSNLINAILPSKSP